MAVSTNSSTNKYVVRQPIKDLQGKTIAYVWRTNSNMYFFCSRLS